MAAKWKSQGHGGKRVRTLWNEYVPKHLLPRLYGYELLMAPYAIAHLKIGLKLFETGYRFESDERARVYLTNALEPAGDEQLSIDLPAGTRARGPGGQRDQAEAAVYGGDRESAVPCRGHSAAVTGSQRSCAVGRSGWAARSTSYKRNWTRDLH